MNVSSSKKIILWVINPTLLFFLFVFWVFSWVFSRVIACSMPSTYSPIQADQYLIESVQPKIDAIFEQDSSQMVQIQSKIHTAAMSFETSSRIYYILRELNLYMNSLMSGITPVPEYDGWHNLQPYMLYSPELVDMAMEHWLTIVLNFRASRCPRCKATSEDIISNQMRIPRNAIVIETDFDTTKELQKKYWVTMQTTFVFLDEQWNVLKKTEKLSWIDQLVEELTNLSN